MDYGFTGLKVLTAKGCLSSTCEFSSMSVPTVKSEKQAQSHSALILFTCFGGSSLHFNLKGRSIISIFQRISRNFISDFIDTNKGFDLFFLSLRLLKCGA